MLGAGNRIRGLLRPGPPQDRGRTLSRLSSEEANIFSWQLLYNSPGRIPKSFGGISFFCRFPACKIVSVKIVTRFAPQPHRRSSCGSGPHRPFFNWLFSASLGGDFLLRIEDTDRARSEEKFERQIIESLEWLGLEWQGEIVRQSERLADYGRLAERLIDEDKAYRCYVTAEELGRRREEAREKGEVFRYRREWSQLGAAPGKPYAVRLSVPSGEKISVEDLVRGGIVFDSSEIEDFVILKADGFPTYNFAAAVDDAQMDISHVIRGDDHIINAPRQILIAEALGLLKAEARPCSDDTGCGREKSSQSAMARNPLLSTDCADIFPKRCLITS